MATDDVTWLDADYVQKILRNSRRDESVEVHVVIVKPATAIGENYGSDMLRTSVELSRLVEGHRIKENVSLIAKVMPQSGNRAEMLSEEGFFETEISMMSDTLPKLTRILAEVNVPSLAPECFNVQCEKPVHLIIEDLTPKGFRMVDHQTGLDLDHCLLAIRNLALFHAGSVALKEKDSTAVVNYRKGMFCKDQSAILPAFYKGVTKALGEEVSKWPELDQRISEKLIRLSEVVFEKGREASRYREDDFNVLNHGDLWVNNMLFRYDEQGKPIAQLFVDFQCSYYGSAALDLLYFLCTSSSDEIRISHRELLLQEYYSLLTSTMAKLKCSTVAPSFDKLKEMMKERVCYELAPSFGLLPLILLNKSEAKSLDEITPLDGNFQTPLHNGKLYRKVMTRILPLYNSMGLLDA